MASKAARKRRRLEQERRQLDDLEVAGTVHTHCSAVSLSELGALLGEARDVLRRIGCEASRARAGWPQVPAAYELRAALDEIAASAESSRARLSVAHERAQRLQQSGAHVHLCGSLVVRMVPLVKTVLAPKLPASSPHDDGESGEALPDDEIPF